SREMSDDLWFEQLIKAPGELAPERAPARLTSRVYSALVARMAESGSLLDLVDSKRSGARLCVFETALTVLPLGTNVGSMNPCRICHARLLGERMAHAPIFWPGCPYSEFHHG
ncbi:MAG: hypothetical protein ACRD3C_00090, partial [Vicinamibacterales bacterium]